jgi:hypothetical protein
MATKMKHIGKMQNNGAKVVVAYRTLPGDSGSALVIGTNSLSDSWHDALMNLVQETSGQQANELADLLAVRKFPDGQNMLAALHQRGSLKKVPTTGVIMTPSSSASIPLNELNELIAQQKGIKLDELAITDGKRANKKTPIKDDPTKTTSSTVNAGDEIIVDEPVIAIVADEDLSPTQLRSKADALFKQAQLLRKQADEVDPPKSRKKKEVVVD